MRLHVEQKEASLKVRCFSLLRISSNLTYVSSRVSNKVSTVIQIMNCIRESYREKEMIISVVAHDWLVIKYSAS